MSAAFADPHWAYVWPAYALAVLCFTALALAAFLRLRKWTRAAKETEEG